MCVLVDSMVMVGVADGVRKWVMSNYDRGLEAIFGHILNTIRVMTGCVLISSHTSYLAYLSVKS